METKFWIESDAIQFRQRGAQTLVAMTPNWICDEKLYPSYRQSLAKPSRLGVCVHWLRNRQHEPLDNATATRLCETYTFTGAGSSSIADRVRKSATASGWKMLEATEMTRGRCNATDDARHYPSLVPIQAQRVVELLS